MNTNRIEEIQKLTSQPESQSVYTALCQVWNEVGQEYQEEVQAITKQLEQAQARIDTLDELLTEALDIQQDNYGNAISTHINMIKWAEKARTNK